MYMMRCGGKKRGRMQLFWFWNFLGPNADNGKLKELVPFPPVDYKIYI